MKYRNMTIALGETARISCNVTSRPKANFQWLLGKTPLPIANWTANFDDVTGTSTLAYKFKESDLDDDCKMRVVCVATNSYGRSEHHFLLTPSSSDVCSRILAATATSSSTSPVITIATDQGLAVNGVAADNSSDEMGGTTFTIIIALFTVAATVIVVGVFILLCYFLRHFCTKKRLVTLCIYKWVLCILNIYYIYIYQSILYCYKII